MNHALVIGVSSTQYLKGRFPELPGVKYDVEAVSSLLKQRNFDTSTCGTGDDTSARAVAGRLLRFVELTGPGDLGIIYLAGHGYRVPDRSRRDRSKGHGNADEPDGWDEAFVCSDQLIRDDWWRESLWTQVRPAARIVTVVDACHSGFNLGLRAGPPPPPVQVPPPVVKDYYRLTLCACRDEETALDYARNDEGGGVVTMEMLDLLRSEPSLSYDKLWTRVATGVRDRYTSKEAGTPQLLYHGPDGSLLHSTAFTILPPKADPGADEPPPGDP